MAMHKRGCPVRADFDPLSPVFLSDPFAVLHSIPSEMSVFYAPSIDYYVVTRYADIEAILLDSETYSAAPAQLPLAQLVPEAAQILNAFRRLLRNTTHGSRWMVQILSTTKLQG